MAVNHWERSVLALNMGSFRRVKYSPSFWVYCGSFYYPGMIWTQGLSHGVGRNRLLMGLFALNCAQMALGEAAGLNWHFRLKQTFLFSGAVHFYWALRNFCKINLGISFLTVTKNQSVILVLKCIKETDKHFRWHFSHWDSMVNH